MNFSNRKYFFISVFFPYISYILCRQFPPAVSRDIAPPFSALHRLQSLFSPPSCVPALRQAPSKEKTAPPSCESGAVSFSCILLSVLSSSLKTHSLPARWRCRLPVLPGSLLHSAIRSMGFPAAGTAVPVPSGRCFPADLLPASAKHWPSCLHRR